MKLKLLITTLALIMSVSLMAQKNDISGLWEYKPTGTFMEIKISKDMLITDIDGFKSIRTYAKESRNKYKSKQIEDLYLEVISKDKIITYNTKTNSQNTWYKFGDSSLKMASEKDVSSSNAKGSKAKDNSSKTKNSSNSKASNARNNSTAKSNSRISSNTDESTTKVASSMKPANGSFLNIGVGFLSSYAGGGGIPPLSISYNRPYNDKIMIGGFVTYAQTNYNAGLSEFNWGYRFISIGARGSYHFDFGPEKLDPYAGILLGYTIGSITGDCGISCGGSASSIAWAGMFGARYQLTPKIKTFLEFGYGISNVTIGVSLDL